MRPIPLVLGNTVDQRDDNRDNGRKNPGHRRVVSCLYKVRSRILTEPAKLTAHENQQQNIAACPAENIGEGKIAVQEKDSGNTEKGCSAHPA